MRTNVLIGVILIVLGICAFAYQGFSVKTREKDVDAGPIQISHTETHNVPIPPIAGGVAIIAGVVLLLGVGSRRAA